MLDTYTTGGVSRISPEAPVPVLHVEDVEHLPGGAGNVALNLVSLGARVSLLSRIGPDIEGKQLVSFLTEKGVDTSQMYVERSYTTPVKNRLIGSGQQIVRLDRERLVPLSELAEEEMVRSIDINAFDIVAISDYGKGVMTKTLTSRLISLARDAGIPVVVDPKGDDFTKYAKATLIKPNAKEARLAAPVSELAALDRIGEALLAQTKADMILITRSQEGVSLFCSDGRRIDSPVKVREILDVTGAGDTVLAVVTLALAASLELPDMLALSNIAAGIAIEHIGCYRVTLTDLATRLLDLHAESKIFDETHLVALKHALTDRPYTLLTLTPPFSQDLYGALCRAKQPNAALIVYTPETDPKFLELLASLSEVDFVVTSEQALDILKEPLETR